ncbi:MAG TPA: PEGA domain-containing protein [Candidatus Saccharimonadales bacterium]|nr:PEGA domain-containing protein [Candidatus Saccharimonadales bacterium]
MHKHPRSKKHRKLIIRFLIYGVMVVSTLLISALCILLVLGYRFNLTKHTVTQGGLLQFDSQPASASVEVDGQAMSFKTPGKRNVAAGQHAVSMTLDGYRPWSKTVSVKAGQLVWLNYTRFVPTNINTSTVKNFSSLSQLLASPDRKWLALWTNQTMSEFVLADVSDSDQPKFTDIKLPAKALTKTKGQQFRLQEWDYGSRYLLIDHKFSGGHDFILLDREHPDQAVNLDSRFGLDISTVHFADTSGNSFYVMADGDLRRLDLSGKTISAPLVKQAVSFSPYGDGYLSYVARADNGYDIGVMRDGDSKPVAHYQTKQPVKSVLTKYFGHNYLAIGSADEVVIYKDPFAESTQPPVRRIKLDFDLGWLDYASNGRFLLAGNKDNFMTFDGDTKTTYQGRLDGARNDNQPFLWLDDYHFVTTGNERLRMVEFDGANPEFITTAQPGFDAALSNDGKVLFSVIKHGAGYSLQASQLVINP